MLSYSSSDSLNVATDRLNRIKTMLPDVPFLTASITSQLSPSMMHAVSSQNICEGKQAWLATLAICRCVTLNVTLESQPRRRTVVLKT